VLMAAILCQMDRHHFIREALEVKGYANSIRGGRTEIGIEFHGGTPACTAHNLAGAAPVGDMEY
jgi:hypothetical protein